MPFYTEGLLWYLLCLDALFYNFLVWASSKWFRMKTHWASSHIPLNKVMGMVYLALVIWLGFTLYRMRLIIFW